MPCYRKGGCGPYEMYPCGECPASSPEYLKTGDSPVTIGAIPTFPGQYILKDQAIAIVKEQMANHFAGDYAKLCPKCGKIAFWSTYFQGYRCIGCDDIIKSDNTTDPRIQGIINAIEKESGMVPDDWIAVSSGQLPDPDECVTICVVGPNGEKLIIQDAFWHKNILNEWNWWIVTDKVHRGSIRYDGKVTHWRHYPGLPETED